MSNTRLTEIFDRRIHLSHTNDVCDGTFRSNDAAECVGILLTELLEQDQAKLAQQLVFATLLDHNSETGREDRQPAG